MKTNLKAKRESGFTIIEVLIVLAIAGLIMVIVFLAVPALQRNSRNTQRRSDASRLLSVTQEWINNNSGSLPSGAAAVTCAGTGGGAGKCDLAASPNNAMQIWQLGNASNIDGFTIGIQNAITAVTPVLTAGNANQATLVTGVKCGAVTATTVTPTATGATARSLVFIYAIENQAGAAVPVCVES